MRRPFRDEPDISKLSTAWSFFLASLNKYREEELARDYMTEPTHFMMTSALEMVEELLVGEHADRSVVRSASDDSDNVI